MTGLEFGIGVAVVIVLVGYFFYTQTRLNIEEQKLKALREAQDDQKIKSDVHGLSDDELREIIRLRGVTKKPEA